MTTIALKFPVEHNGKTYSEVTIRRPNVGDMVAAEKISDGSDYAFNAAVCASVSDIPWPAFKLVDAADSDAIAVAMRDVVGNSPAAAGAN